MHWRPERFLEVKAVLVDVFMNRSGSSSRYSSYTKGYGESHRSPRRQKTPVSYELDGEETVSVDHIDLSELPFLLYLNVLEVRRKFRKKS